MTYQERFNQIQTEAQRTNSFAYSNYIQELYIKLLRAIERKDKLQTKQLIARMGF